MTTTKTAAEAPRTLDHFKDEVARNYNFKNYDSVKSFIGPVGASRLPWLVSITDEANALYYQQQLLSETLRADTNFAILHEVSKERDELRGKAVQPVNRSKVEEAIDNLEVLIGMNPLGPTISLLRESLSGDGWIKVTDRFPQDELRVLCLHEDSGNMFISYRTKDCLTGEPKWWNGDMPSHWIPLPPPTTRRLNHEAP